MNLLKVSLLSAMMFCALNINAKSLSGIVTIKGKVPKGILHVFAKVWKSDAISSSK